MNVKARAGGAPSHLGADSRLAGRGWRIAVLVATGVAGLVWVLSLPRIPQDPAYHRFADHRQVLGIPNGLDVLSNAPFALVGLAGLRLLRRGRGVFQHPGERWPWLVLFVGVALTSVGSAWYHLAPTNERLVWDRIPIAVGFMGLLAALVTERVDRRAGLLLLGPLVLAGLASVLYWIQGEHAGSGDLRPYLFVQLYPLVAIPILLLLFPGSCTGSGYYLLALAAYVLAKVAEIEDAPVLAAGGIVGGHTLKHLLAAAGIGALVGMIARRRVRDR